LTWATRRGGALISYRLGSLEDASQSNVIMACHGDRISSSSVRTSDSDSARCRILSGSGLLVPATEFNELVRLPLGGGDCILLPSRGTAPLSAAGFSGAVPSEVCMFLLAGGRAVAAWFFFDLKRKAMVCVQQSVVNSR
jgi:hypothetical protein